MRVMTEEQKTNLRAAAARRSEQLRQAKQNALKIGKYSIWPNEDDYWVLVETNDAGNEGGYRYYPTLAWCLKEVLNGKIADAAREAQTLLDAIVKAEKEIELAVSR